MANFNSEFKKILKELEDNISDKNALETAKVEMLKLYNLFFDEITDLEQTINDRMVEMAQTQLDIEEKLKSMDKSIKRIPYHKEIYKKRKLFIHCIFLKNCNFAASFKQKQNGILVHKFFHFFGYARGSGPARQFNFNPVVMGRVVAGGNHNAHPKFA